jgi:F0F1-type ATP synthase gamma subunit
MDSIKNLDGEIEQLVVLKSLVNVYGEVALNRMNAIRTQVLFSRAFLEEIEGVFGEVQSAYLKQLGEEVKSGGKAARKKLTVLAHNGLTVSVFISANTRLYGDLVQKTYEAFAEEYRKGETEATIVGSVGLSMFKEEFGEKKPYTYFDFPDEKIDQKALEEMVKHLVQYEEMRIFYGKYRNVITQEAERYVLTASKPINKRGEKQEPHFYLFEPTLEVVMRYFETEIFGTLFDQTLREGQLAKFAARLVAMDRAEQNTDERMKVLGRERLALVHRQNNTKQLNTMGPILMSFGR